MRFLGEVGYSTREPGSGPARFQTDHVDQKQRWAFPLGRPGQKCPKSIPPLQMPKEVCVASACSPCVRLASDKKHLAVSERNGRCHSLLLPSLARKPSTRISAPIWQ